MLISKGDEECPQDPAANLNFKLVSRFKGCFQKAVNEPNSEFIKWIISELDMQFQRQSSIFWGFKTEYFLKCKFFYYVWNRIYSKKIKLQWLCENSRTRNWANPRHGCWAEDRMSLPQVLQNCPRNGRLCLGTPFKRTWAASLSKSSVCPVDWRDEQQARVLGLVDQMSRHSLSSFHWHLNHVLDVA